MFYFYFISRFNTEEDDREKGKLYKPQTKREDKVTEKSNEYAKILTPTSSSSSSSSSAKKDASAKKAGKVQEKKKSNLELFKEELRQ